MQTGPKRNYRLQCVPLTSGQVELALREDCGKSRRSKFSLAGILRSFDLDKSKCVILLKVDMSSRQLSESLEFRNKVWVSDTHFGTIRIVMV